MSLPVFAAPPGYVLRRPSPDEAASVQAVLDAAESADAGEPRRNVTTVATEWSDDRCHPESDWWLAADGAGRVAAAGWVWPQPGGPVLADLYVHPGHRGRGIGEALLDVIEARALELAARGGSEVFRELVLWCEDSDVVRRASADHRGFVPERVYFEMAIALDAPPPETWPAGIEPRAFRPGLDEGCVYEADQEAFAEHHLFEPKTFQEWRAFHVEAPEQDPTLWRLAWSGDDLAGFVIASADDLGGLVGDLAVRKAWRGRGIGRALLLAAFALLRERGQTVARLYVDAQNVTDAVRLYEAAGMRVSRHFDVLVKPLG